MIAGLLRRRARAALRRRLAAATTDRQAIFRVRAGQLARPSRAAILRASALWRRVAPAEAAGAYVDTDVTAWVTAAYPAVAAALGRGLPEGSWLVVAVARPRERHVHGICATYAPRDGAGGSFLLLSEQAVAAGHTPNVATHELGHAIHDSHQRDDGVRSERVAVAAEAAVALRPDAWGKPRGKTAEAVAWLNAVGPEAALAYARGAVAGRLPHPEPETCHAPAPP